MSVIRVMSSQMSNRIAAGEVIERPASVVKELVENAIDAGAKNIRIDIERAGTKLVRVSDDGCGMDADDALLALQEHATSKIIKDDDIDKIKTLGFRGEALPSIGSVAKLTLVTRRVCDMEGTKVSMSAGALLKVDPVGTGVGTVISVAELFFNTPARKKFLKTTATEEHHIEEMVLLLALPYSKVGFTLTMDGRKVFQSPGADDLGERLRVFFGKSFASQMLPVAYDDGTVKIHGYIAGPGLTRNSRREQRTFVNGRAVESLAIYRGLREGYATLAERGRYSPCVLFCEVAPEEVDVNVHPAKKEVRFKQEFVISRAVSRAVTEALSQVPKPQGTYFETLRGTVPMSSVLAASSIDYRVKDVVAPDLLIDDRVEQYEKSASPSSFPHVTQMFEDDVDLGVHFSRVDFLTDRDADIEKAPAVNKNAAPIMPTLPRKPDDLSFQVEFPEEVLGIYDDTYILCRGRKGLILIDQHAAHERVMYEKLLLESEKDTHSQALLIPIVLDLPRNSIAMLLRNQKTFAQLGFDIEPLGSNTIMLNAIPAVVPTVETGSLLQDIMSELLENDSAQTLIQKEYIARAACKAAVKAHDRITIDGAKLLLEQMRRCQQGTLCPHGRPTMMTLSKSELERRFGR